MVLVGIEFDSIWAIAHKWADKDPSNSDPDALNDFVKARIQLMARAVILRRLTIRDSDGMPIMESNIVINAIWDHKPFWHLRASYFHNKFNKEILDSHYLSRSELFRWCEAEYLSFPQYWIDDNAFSKVPEALKDKPASTREKDKAACRALASLLWSIDPRIAPKHMAESKQLKQFGNAHNYTDEKTVKGWIADLDPQKNERKEGRPPIIDYYIDLKNGGLNPKGIETRSEK
jgi:hypothetical protein